MEKAAVIRVDGTGLGLADSTMRVMHNNPLIEFVPCEAGEEWWKEHGRDSLIPDEIWDILHETDACFKGPVTTSGVVGTPMTRSVAASIRQRLDEGMYQENLKNTLLELGRCGYVRMGCERLPQQFC